MTRAKGRLRLTIVNSRARDALYRITPADWRAACARHAALARFVDATIGWDDGSLARRLHAAEAVIGVPAQRDHLAERAPHLQWLHHTSAGVDGLLPLDWLPRTVAFTNNSGAHGAKVEEYLRMAYTALQCRLPEMIANQHARRWRQVFTPALRGKTTLVIGMGDLGRAAARAARQVGLRVIGVSRSGRRVREADAVHTLSRLDALLPAADFVVLAVPLTPETRGLIDRERLARLKPTAGLINVARGEVIDQRALIARLRRRKLAGAVLDVVEPEPLPPGSPLWRTPNLLITPHVSCDDAARYNAITLDLWFANLDRFLSGRPLKGRVDPRRGY